MLSSEFLVILPCSIQSDLKATYSGKLYQQGSDQLLLEIEGRIENRKTVIVSKKGYFIFIIISNILLRYRKTLQKIYEKISMIQYETT